MEKDYPFIKLWELFLLQRLFQRYVYTILCIFYAIMVEDLLFQKKHILIYNEKNEFVKNVKNISFTFLENNHDNYNNIRFF